MTAKWYRWDGDDVVLHVRVQPRASRDEVAGEYGDALKIRITAPPVDGAANAHLIGWLAGQFQIPKSRITLESGETGRDKRLRIQSPRVLLPGMSRP